MLDRAPGLIAEVSQSGRVWLQPSEPKRADVLLKAAPSWLLLDPARKPVFANAAGLVRRLARQGFGGIYLGMTGERPDLWLAAQAAIPAQNSASLDFDPQFGDEAEFDRLKTEAEQAGLELGSTLLPVATGQGPDFLLQARHAAGHGGLYAMLPAPPELTDALPKARDEWDCHLLDEAAFLALVRAGVLPEHLARDALLWASEGGWAVTGPIMGTDGQSRRWLYRFAETPLQPVLAWQDPSGRAARLLSAAVILQTGLQGQALTGLRLEPLMGLEPGADGSLSPGIYALNELSRQIHRYGGWALQADPLPVSAIEAVLAGPCDFCRDDVTELLALFGLLAADGRPVAALYRDWIGKKLDVSRLARGLAANFGLYPRLLQADVKWREQFQRLNDLGALIGENAAFGLPAELVSQFLLTWKLGLPGLAFVAENAIADPRLASLLQARKETGLAQGAILSVTRGHGGGFGLLSRLPGGGFWLLACNFGVNPDELLLSLPGSCVSAQDAADKTDLAAGFENGKFRLSLAGRSARNIILK